MRWVERVAYLEMTNTADSVLHAAHRLYQQFQSTCMNTI